MKKICFDIFIGKNTITGMSNDIVAYLRIVNPSIYIPHGDCNLDGSDKKCGIEYFKRLYSLGTFIADVIDLANEFKFEVTATIHLNIYSLKKVFRGKDIVLAIDKIDSIDNWQQLRSFDIVSNVG